MIIDFHIHTFPDALAERAVKKLSETAKIPSYTDGTVTDTLRKMKQWKVDKGVFLNIATKPSQQRTINDRCLSMNDPLIIPFGSVHIDSEDRLEELERVKKLGMKGIKLHPDYQGFFFDDPRAYPVYERCADLGLIVVIHAGSDPVSPGGIHADPQAIVRVLDRFPRLILVAAHFGGTMCFGILSANRCIWIQRFLLETSPLIPRGRSFVRMARIGSCLAVTVHGTARPWMQSLSAHWA